MFYDNSTIYAVAVPKGYSGVSLIRISGSGCRNLFGKELKKNRPLHKIISYGGFYNSQTKEKIDQLTYCFFEGPRSFTGEDVLELFPHGNPLIIDQILEALSHRHGFRLAHRGEFTQRALENQKMDLIQVESLHTVIHAKHQTILKKAQKSLGGHLSKILKNLKQNLEWISIQLELDIDFSEEELDPTYDQWEIKLEEIKHTLEEMCENWQKTKHLHQDISIGFFGKPNVGKSSLINNLIGTDRLLVSNSAGTTRDYIEVSFKLKSGVCTLVDTAGLGDAVDQIDFMAMKKTTDFLKVVDFKILLIDGTESHRLVTEDNVKFDLVVATKKDLKQFDSKNDEISISNLTLEGIEDLKEKLDELVFGEIPKEDSLTSERQYQYLSRALYHIKEALKMIHHHPNAELVSFEVKQTYQQLEDLIGKYQPNEILNQIFQGFCIGK